MNTFFKIDFKVFVHIQKTGGTEFDINIAKYLLSYDEESGNWKQACELSANKTAEQNTIYKKFYCYRIKTKRFFKNYWFNNWYFSRQTFSWYCGVHADYTTLKSCLTKVKKEYKFLDKVVFITILRDPIKRYISEWNHIRVGTLAWNMSNNICNKENFLNSCLKNKNSTYQISIEEFIGCEGNMANNRQTRMLASYNSKNDDCKLFQSENKMLLLENAKQVLKNLKFFALNEYQEMSQELFENVFKNQFRFSKKFEQAKNENASKLVENLDKNQIEQIYKLNELDVKLYEYAKEIFFERLKFYRQNFLH